MTNTNCLEGVCCPKYGQEDRFKIAAIISCLVTDPGSEPARPRGKNDDHSAWAGFALATFVQVTATDEEDALGDLLADLMHWSDRNSYDFDAALERARGHCEAETAEELPT